MRQEPRRCTANCCSATGKPHFSCAPAGSKRSCALASYQFLDLEEIVNNAADRKALVMIQGMLEKSPGDRAGIENQVLPNQAAGIREALGKPLVGGEQEQTGGLRAVRADYNGF